MLVECEEYGQHFDQNMSDYYRTIKQKLTEKPILCLETEEVLSESHGFLYETKEAVTVRYLTKRYIGEYSSTSDFLYRHNVTFDNVTTEVEILDTSKCASNWTSGTFITDLSKFMQKRVRFIITELL
ncbi:hypothetical protein QE152_g7100 [Popillia japonica]|uniref:small monomeric GTPase n=1 Tax=Popillia japonica TaxID=7064 RepID=A0AAW1MGM0_POPJA